MANPSKERNLAIIKGYMAERRIEKILNIEKIEKSLFFCKKVAILVVMFIFTNLPKNTNQIP